MNWRGAKTILIILFILVDIFLAIVLAETHSNVNNLSEETVSATVQVLEEHGLHLEASVVPLAREKNRNIVMRNHFENPEDVAEKMLTDFVVQKADEENRDFQFEDKEAFLKIGNSGVYYSTKRAKETYAKGDEPTLATMATRVMQELSHLGFRKKDMQIVKGSWDEGVYRCRVVPVFEDKLVCGIALSVSADRQGIFHLEGSWFSPTEVEEFGAEPLIDITTVLSGLIYRPDCQNMWIVGIENAFYVSNDYLQSRELSAVPVYLITDSAGRRLCFDGRTGAEYVQ